MTRNAYLSGLGWFFLSLALIINCFPGVEPTPAVPPLTTSDGGVGPLKAARQVAITPTGNGFFKVVSGVPVGGINTPVGATVDLSTSNDVSNNLQPAHGGTGLNTLGSVGQGLCVNGSATGYTFCTFGSSSSSSGGTSAGVINTVQLSDGAGGFLAATNVKGGTNFLSAGATVANAGSFRTSNNVPIAMALNAAGSANIAFGDTDTSNNLYVGTTSANTSQAATVILRATGGVIFGSGNTNVAAANASLGLFTTQNSNFAVLGSQTVPSYASGTGEAYFGNTSVPPTSNPTAGGLLYAELGGARWRSSGGIITAINGGVTRSNFVFAGTNILTAIQNAHFSYIATGATNGATTQFLAPSSDEDSYVRLVRIGRDTSCSPSGSCTGSHTITTGSGTTQTLTTDSFSALMLFTTTGVNRVTAPYQN